MAVKITDVDAIGAGVHPHWLGGRANRNSGYHAISATIYDRHIITTPVRNIDAVGAGIDSHAPGISTNRDGSGYGVVTAIYY